MEELIYLAINNPVATIAITAVVATPFILSNKKKGKSISGNFVAIPHLTTKAEQNFYNQLYRKLPDGFSINCKVRLADLCKPKDPSNIVAFNKVARKHVDFVISDTQTNKVICAIELDDRSHNKADSVRRDNDKNYALKSAGIPIIRIKNTRRYGENALNQVLQCLDVTGKARQTFSPGGKVNVLPPKEIAGDKCPRCGSEKYEKINMKFLNKGKYFYECGACSYRTDVY
jgi:hypothetical protein